MADKPTGPVKPPTLDLTARKPAPDIEKKENPAAPSEPAPAQKPAAETKPAAAAAAPRDAPKNMSGPQKPSVAANPAPPPPLLALAATGLGGALAGLAAAYGLAIAGHWPQAGGVSQDAFSALEIRMGRAENRLELNTANLSGLEERVGAVEAAPVPQLPSDLLTPDALAPLEERVLSLDERIEAVATGIPADQSSAFSEEIARLGGALAEIESRLDQPDDVVDALSTSLETLSSRLQALESMAAAQADIDAMRAERDRFARLPAATAALETAVTAGQPFGAELAAVETLVPELGITNAVRTIAANGVKPTREIARNFRALVPALLAARPQDPQAGWLDTFLAQAQSAIALRPIEGEEDTPEVAVGRIERALDNDDAAAARALILDLPEPMQAVAAPVRTDLDAVIAARALVSDIRALAPAAEEAAR
ncbi:COG4223 family protein [Pelagibacterium limicola]|uniref:COG4223 family protein n=1 Tax=Pelagibacterium limicola TaxID=2791022 RepID=UPI0018AFB134|nr:hypothetical protein [Pelagibacterium limicola]